MHCIYYYAERHYAKCRSTDTPKVANITRKYKTQMKIIYLTMLCRLDLYGHNSL